MRPEDLPKVVAIEKRAYQYPWSQAIFRDCLLAGYTNRAMERDDNACGYAIMSVAAREAHLLNLCIDPGFQRLGYGSFLLDHMLEIAQQSRVREIFLEVRASNQAALALYRAANFNEIAVRRAYYRAVIGREDAVVLARQLDGSN